MWEEITSNLQEKLGKSIKILDEIPEKIEQQDEKFYGITYYIGNGEKLIRFRWKQGEKLSKIDIWNKHTFEPQIIVDVHGKKLKKLIQSLEKFLG